MVVVTPTADEGEAEEAEECWDTNEDYQDPGTINGAGQGISGGLQKVAEGQ